MCDLTVDSAGESDPGTAKGRNSAQLIPAS